MLSFKVPINNLTKGFFMEMNSLVDFIISIFFGTSFLWHLVLRVHNEAGHLNGRPLMNTELAKARMDNIQQIAHAVQKGLIVRASLQQGT